LLIWVVGIITLFRVCRPFNAVRGIIWGGVTVISAASIFLLDWFFALVPLESGELLVFLTLALLSFFMLGTFHRIVDVIFAGVRKLGTLIKRASKKLKDDMNKESGV
ncbi:MAG: hypothetical protein WCQ72_05250, partial [Eubacteriales bacterium]